MVYTLNNHLLQFEQESYAAPLSYFWFKGSLLTCDSSDEHKIIMRTCAKGIF